MKKVVTAVVLCCTGMMCAAADVGQPSCSAPDRVEFYYEHFSRNISQDYISNVGVGDQEENRYIARYSRRVSPRLSLNASAGMSHSDVAENDAPLLGLGANFTALRSEPVNVNLFASGAYVHEIKYGQEGSIERDANGNVILDRPAVDQTESYVELISGVAFSHDIKLGHDLSLTPYGGVMVSKIMGDEEYRLTYNEDGGTDTVTGDLRESGLASFFAGLAVSLNDTWSLRVEGRFLNQASFSAGASHAF